MSRNRKGSTALASGSPCSARERAGERPIPAPVLVEFERPGVAVDQQQFPDADPGVEVELLARAVVGADDLDGEIGAAEPVRALRDRRVAREVDGDVGASVVLRPVVGAVADVDALEDFPRPGQSIDDPKTADKPVAMSWCSMFGFGMRM